MSLSPNSHDKIEDSLDNLSNLKLRQSSLEKQRLELIQLKQRFISLLEKLQTSETREISLAELKKLIEKHAEPDHLKMYLSILKSLKPDHNSTTKEHEVLVISIITKVFRSNLIDPLDKQPSLLKTCFKVVEICLGFFNDNSNTVQQACARVLLDLNEFCLEEGKYDRQQKLSILFAPLMSILKNGVDKASQGTATVCINELIKYWYANQARQYLDIVAKEVFSIILKINSEYHEIFMATIILIEHKGLSFFQNKLPNFLSKILPIIDGTRQNTNSLNSYMCKVNICKILEKVALLLSSQEKQKLSDLNIINSLTKAARNKIIQVQTAASRAIKAWKGESLSIEKPLKSSSSIGKPLRSLQQIRDQKKRQRSNSKQNTIKIETELEYMKQDLQKMVKGGWGANNRAKQFVKRGSGVGGGHYGQVETTPPKSTKSHRQHLEELRSLIKKGTKENKKMDKFSEFAEAGSQLKQQVPMNSNNNVKVFMQYNQRDVPLSPQSHQLPVNSNPKRNNYINEENDFQVEEDEGDQLLYLNPNMKSATPISKQFIKDRKKLSQIVRTNSNSSTQKGLQNFYIDPNQAKQLLDYQESLARSGSLNLDLNKEFPQNLNKELAITLNKESAQNLRKKSSQNLNQELRVQQKELKAIKVKDKKIIQRASKIKQNLGDLADFMSQQELQQLMLENNLSQVSQNLGDYLNASDLQMNQQQKLLKSGLQQSIHRTLDLPNTFAKKPSDRFDESLNYTQSQISRFKQSVTKKQNKEFSLSNSPPKIGTLKEQFTLNPNNGANSKVRKFQSIQQAKDHELDESIQEQIVESGYEESRPKDESLLPLKTGLLTQKPSRLNELLKKSPKRFFGSNEVETEEVSKNYQQLIQNPPKLYDQPKHLDKKSLINQQISLKGQSSLSMQGKDDVQYEEEEQETVTDKWIRILSLVENREINQAFEQAFGLDDPIYLIRLLIMTRTPISSLTAQNCSNLWSKFLDIYQHNFISIMFVQLFSQAQQLNLIKNSLTIQEMHELLVKLYEVSGTSKGKLSFNAAQLYNKVDEDLRPNKRN